MYDLRILRFSLSYTSTHPLRNCWEIGVCVRVQVRKIGWLLGRAPFALK